MSSKLTNLIKSAIPAFLVLTISVTSVYAYHGGFVSIQPLLVSESFDRSKDIPIRFIINNNSEDECILVSSVGVGFAEPIPRLPAGAPINFTMPDNSEIAPLSYKTYTVNIRIHSEMLPGEYRYQIFASVNSCSETIDPNHTSSLVSGPLFGLKVDPPKSQCVIATATYGSELAPEVQFLRNFRDNVVLSTYSGSNFMTLFNSFYYSWSPYVADTIRDSEGLKGISRIMIAPLLGILKVGSIAGENESGVIVSGILSSMLIGAVYVTPLSIGSLVALKRNVKKHHIKYALVTWVAAIVMTIGASMLRSDVFMMTSTGILVLSSIVLSSVALTFAIKRLWHCRRN